MLVVGRAKVNKAGASGRVALVESDTQRLPLPPDTFGVVSVAFGLRNVCDTVRGIDEMIRVARPGGKVAILEFSRPRRRLFGRLYLAFFRHLLPRRFAFLYLDRGGHINHRLAERQVPIAVMRRADD